MKDRSVAFFFPASQEALFAGDSIVSTIFFLVSMILIRCHYLNIIELISNIFKNVISLQIVDSITNSIVIILRKHANAGLNRFRRKYITLNLMSSVA